MRGKNSYSLAGAGLLVCGVLLFLPAYFVLHLSWLAALGVCMLILSLILLALGRSIPKLSPEVCSILLETGINNMAMIIEELGVKNKAIYLPSSLTNGRPQALIPLNGNQAFPVLNGTLPQRLIVRYGSTPQEIGLLLSTIGSTVLGMLESKPGPTSAELESALNMLLAGRLGLANSTSVVCDGNHVQIEIHKPRLEDGASWSHHCLGGPFASVAASVTAEAYDRPVIIKQDEHIKGKHFIELEVKV